MVSFTRGFRGRGGSGSDPRLPPGQYDTGTSWPVLTAEPNPRLSAAEWSFTVDGLVDQPMTWSWDELQAMPHSDYHGAIHCVTTWSKFDMTFTGVSVDELLAAARPLSEATHVLARSHTGYTTNLPLDDVVGGRAWIAWDADGEPLSVDHGGPARLLVPHLYFWKSAKFVSGLQLLDHDVPGFWEQNGYHNRGDPWLEQRYHGD